MSRILVGDLHQESHSFNPQVMRAASFAIVEGPDCLDRYRGTNTVAGGIVDAAEAAGVDIIFPVGMHAPAGGRVDHALYLRFKNTMLDAARQGGFDAVLLALHGAMMTTELDDVEADLMRSVRQVVGPQIPITAGFDLHAHVTELTIAECDFLTAYRTNPHGDMAVTGQRLFARTDDIVKGEFEPVCAYVHFPMLTLGNDRTDQEPLQSIMRRCRTAEALGRVVDVSVFTVQQFLDISNMGQTILVYGNGVHGDALALAEDIGGELWAARDSLVEVFPSVDEQIARAKSGKQKVTLILGDQGDRVAAGSPGDSPYILSRVLELGPELKVAVPVTDPIAVEILRRHTIGDTVTLSVGGAMSQGYYDPITITGILTARSENEQYTMHGPMAEGLIANTGPFAIVRIGEIDVILTDNPSHYIDPNNFVAMGIDPAAKQIVVTRSGYHYTLNFAHVGDCVVVGTPGMTSYNAKDLPFTVARPFYPVDDIPYRPQRAIRRRNSVPGHGVTARD
ncbi:M81 family metallopeptidase [Devosia sp. 919]|uniref:M81 family metallopeptidase n=1 Tax=Devosia sp. 919 TaxID=2726065 RepID=UPI0015547F6E|nr:M81 family metallopeptidase [Devosia sp. 919]